MAIRVARLKAMGYRNGEHEGTPSETQLTA